MDFPFTYLNSAAALALSLLLFIFIQRRRSKSAAVKSSLPPEAAGAWPVIGHLHLLNSSQLPHIALGAMADKYGPAFMIRLGVKHRGLVVSSWEMAKDCFTGTNDIAVSTRPSLAATEHMAYGNAMFGFGPYDAYWRELRKITMVELLSNRRLELLRHVRASEVENFIRGLYGLWRERESETEGVLMDMKQWFGNLTLSITVRMVVGKRYLGGFAGDEGQEEAQRCQKALRDFFHLVGQFVVGDAVPFLKPLDLGGHERAMKRTAKELDSIMEGWLEEHHRKRNSDAAGEQDFMDVLLSVLQGPNFVGYDSRVVSKATCLSMILGGSDTTMVVLTWALSLLVNNPHTMKKVQAELDLHVSRERQVDESDISKLVYLQAVTKETLRLYPVAPLSGQRLFTEDCTVGGFHVPKGTWLMVNVWKIQSDPRVWADPSEFRPERFLDGSHKEVDVRGQHFELLPFGGGRRACPGISFGLVVVNLVLASLLHAFDFSTPGDAPVDMAETFGLTNVKTNPLELVLTPRLPPHAYEPSRVPTATNAST